MAATCLVVMGVSGTGKSTVARLLADRLGWRMAEADEFHPEANIAKMQAGIPLTDRDREPWLQTLRDWISAQATAGENTVVACSALKRAYRDTLRQSSARTRFVHLHGTSEVVRARLADRSGHFMPPALLDSQYSDLELLASDEAGATVDVDDTQERITESALRQLGLDNGAPRPT